MAQWATFVGVVGVILGLLLVLARLSTPALSATEPSTEGSTNDPSTGDPAAVADESVPDSVLGADETLHRRSDDGSRELSALSTPALLANVAISQGLFAVLLITMAWYTEIPPSAFGLSSAQFTLGAVATGVAVGGVFYGLNETAAVVARRRGMATPTDLRESLAPETAAGWTVLLFVVLPVIAGFEELLFRGALIGVVHAGFGVSPWLLAVGSSVAFGLGHGTQGRLGIVVTALLGVGLAIVFILTDSLLAVIVAHYVINSLEFVVHEGLEVV